MYVSILRPGNYFNIIEHTVYFKHLTTSQMKDKYIGSNFFFIGVHPDQFCVDRGCILESTKEIIAQVNVAIMKPLLSPL